MKKIILFTLLFSISIVKAQPKIYSEKEVSIAPCFPGGWNYWIVFVEKNFKWTPEKNAKHISVEFTVQSNGSVTNVKVLNKGSLNEKEALRVMALSPKWSPATLKGKAVPCRLLRGMFNPYFDDENGGSITIKGVSDDTNIVVNSDEVERGLNVVDDNTLYNVFGAEVKPEFPGGMQKFYDFFNANFKIKAVDEELTGKIFVTFIVEKDGSLSDIKVIRDMGYGTGEEALRVLKMSPKWTPGQIYGRVIRTQYSTIPFNIDANNISQPLKK